MRSSAWYPVAGAILWPFRSPPVWSSCGVAVQLAYFLEILATEHAASDIFCAMVVVRLFQHVGIHHQIEGAGAVRSQLAHDNVLSHAAQRVNFSMEGSLEQDLDGLLERALSQSA